MRASALFLFMLLPGLAVCRPAAAPEEPCGEVNGSRIAWDHSSARQIARHGGYPRLKRLQDNSLAAIYETYTGHIDIRRSRDDGASWSAPERIFSRFTYRGANGDSTFVNASNPEIIQLADGFIIAGCNYRPAKPEIAPFSIVVKRSTDNGATWLPPQILYDAAPRFNDGCWEPSFLQLPGGEVHVYFANENPYRRSDEQEISVIRSMDDGATWGEAATVSFRPGKRDGMPVAALVGDEIVVVIEDNNVDRFKPYTVRTRLTENWTNPVLAASPDREYALAETINDTVYMGAPYILALPSGETLISYQTNEHRDENWELSTMEVAVGDAGARNFGKRTRPFDVPAGREAKWNSLALWDESTVAAFASSNFRGDAIAPWLIKGYIVPGIVVAANEITSYPIFIGARGETNMRAGIGAAAGDLLVECRIADNTPVSAEDGVCLYLHDGKETLKIWCDREGKVKVYQKRGSGWRQRARNGVRATVRSGDRGYELEITVPRMADAMADGNAIRLGMSLSAYEPGGTGYTEMLVHAAEDSPGTWLKITY